MKHCRNISSHILNGLDMEKEGTLVLDLGCGPGTWIMVESLKHTLELTYF